MGQPQPEGGSETVVAGQAEPVSVTLDEEFEEFEEFVAESGQEPDLGENANPISLPIGDYRPLDSLDEPVEVEKPRDDDSATS